MVQKKHRKEVSNSFAVFISNHRKAIPLWCQRASQQLDQVVIWDYHVIFVHQTPHKSLVYDLDSTLPFPCEFSEYTSRAIKSDDTLKKEFHRFYRIIPAATYLEEFASDRSHMLDKDKKWMSPPPVYPCIKTTDSSNNLSSFVNMTRGSGYGNVMDSKEFCAYFR